MEKILSIKDLSIAVKNRTLVKNISFDIGEGDVVLLSGQNGVGKSSILKGIMRLETNGKRIDGTITERSFGDILLLGDEELQRYRAKIVYVQQKDEIGRASCRERV